MCKKGVFNKRLALLLMSLLIGLASFSQSSVGDDFWVTFLPNSGEAETVSVIATGETSCSGTIVNPHTNWTTSFSVTPGEVTIVDVPLESYNHDASESVLDIGLHVKSTAPISLYASNYREYSFDVAGVLPVPSLNDEYLVQVAPYSTNPRGGVMSIVAVEDNTVVDIILSCNTDGHTAGNLFTITLNEGQCYQVQASSPNDLSGTKVRARDNKGIAVFAGTSGANVPNQTALYADHCFEQMMPISTWGTRFVVTQSELRDNDVIRVTALNDDCEIRKDGTLIATINAGETQQFEITSDEPACYIETTQPAAVFLYFTGEAYGGTNGDPSMVVITPIEQQIDYVTFGTFKDQPGQIQNHYVNIVTETSTVSGMALDGVSIADAFSPVTGNSLFSYARVWIEHGAHTLVNTMGSYVAHVYGLGPGVSYGYAVGSMAINLTSQILINDRPSSSYFQGFNLCDAGTVIFDLQTNYTVSRAEWSFGDGTTGTGTPVSHNYNTLGDYNVSCDVYKIELGEEILVSTMTATVHVRQKYEVALNRSVCEPYIWNGQVYDQSGTYVYEGLSQYGCDSIVTLNLTVGNIITTNLNVDACDVYHWHGNDYTESGTYTHTVEQADGCDSIYVLTLNLGTSLTTDITAEACNVYRWHGQEYTQSGTYVYTVEVPGGCDSIFNLDLTVNYAPELTISGVSQIAVQTNMTPGIYYYSISDTLNLQPNSVEWSCSNPAWPLTLLGNGFRCRLDVSSIGTGEIKASVEGEGDCDASSVLELNAIYFGLDENNVELNVFPNPANKSVTIESQGITKVRMVDIIGQVVLDNEYGQSNSITLDMNGLHSGIYMLEIMTKHGRTIRRLVVDR